MWGDSPMSGTGREPTADELLLIHTAAELGYEPALSLISSAPQELEAEPRRLLGLLERYSETSPWAAERLAECYLEGCKGVARDAERAVELYQRGAEHGIQESVEGLARALQELGDPDAAIESYA